ncbi:DUF2235 domain-containing protein [Hellea balneolensis]|uniref:DUF2235 domain-containing protein n=1 Tax=Hellea balneolensis TaxID=287478 RepID=UPI000412334B|nr:DUF2235 domain-containing protein [Hellea balneolensis]
MKRIIFCFDGTWQNLSQRFTTNVALTAGAVLTEDAHGIGQLVYYDEGIGNARGVWPALSSKLGGAFGTGLEDDIREAYRFLCLNYRTGDEIFVFGFSRGAFTARSFCGLLQHCGLLKRDALSYEDFMIMEYRSRSTNILEFKNIKKSNCFNYGMSPKIKYLGVWDTVCALGLPEAFKLSKRYNVKYKFHDINLTDNIQTARHAVSIDEIRNMFPVELWEQNEIEKRNSQNQLELSPAFEQLWFAGDHGNVGGGTNNPGLSNISLEWILEAASKLCLGFNSTKIANIRRQREPEGLFDTKEITYKRGALSGMPYSLGGFSYRYGIRNTCDLHHTVVSRYEGKTEYQPKNLLGVLNGGNTK